MGIAHFLTAENGNIFHGNVITAEGCFAEITECPSITIVQELNATRNVMCDFEFSG